jgi:DNA invertase Pin-like site-specific DNA recombinase
MSRGTDANPDAAFTPAVLFLTTAHTGQSDTTKDAEPMVIKRQRELGLLTASALGVGIVKEFIEIGAPATAIGKRPQLRKLLSYLRKHSDVRYAIFPHRARFARNHTHRANLRDQLTQLGVRIVFRDGPLGPISIQ